MIAVGLCRRHTQARRIQASQGDGGLDILVPGESPLVVENYQVKKFADGLDASRKRQIKKSLKSAIATHSGTEFNYTISKWHLAVPMDLTREQERWLYGLADDLAAPFPVEIFGLTSIEELLLEAPSIREYYLGDGMQRVAEILAQMRSLADVSGLSSASTAVQPADAIRSLATLHQRINEEDPHFDYDYEVTKEPPAYAPRPGLIASIAARAAGKDEPYVIWHISTKYDTALDDRPIPGSYTVYPERMTPEQRSAWNQWHDYGTPVTLDGNVVDNFDFDIPGGLGAPMPVGEKLLKLGPAAGEFDHEQATRSLWVIEDGDGVKIADRMISFRLAGRGMGGGEHRKGVDADGYLNVDLYTKATSETGGSLKSTLHVLADLWPGEPVLRVLPAIRFSAAWTKGHFFRPHDEFGLNSADEPIPLEGEPVIPPEVLAAVEDLARISTATKKIITLPKNIGPLARQKGMALKIIADAVCGLEPAVGIAELVLWYDDVPGAYADIVERAGAGSLIVPWAVPFPLLGNDFEFMFELVVACTAEVQPATASEGQAAGQKAARLITTEATVGRLRLKVDRDERS